MTVITPMKAYDSEIADMINQGQRVNWHKVQQINFGQEPSSVSLIV